MQQPPTSDHAQETHECVAEAKHILNVNISRRNTEEKSGCTLRVNNVISFTKLNCPKLVDGAKSPHMDSTKKTSGIKHAAHPLLSMTLDPRIINDTSQNPKTDTLQVLRAHSQALTVALKRPVPLRMTLRPRNQQPLVCPQLHLPHRSNKINSTMSQVLPDSSTVTESVSKITMDVEQVRSPQPLQRSFLFDDQDEENALAAETSAFNASPSPEAHGQDGNNLSPYRHLHPGHVNDREPVAHTSPSRMRSYNVSSGPQATCEPDTSHSNLPTPPQLSSMKLPRKKRREEKRDAFEVLCNHVLATATVHQTPNIHAAAVVIPRTRADILAQRACMETVRRFALQLQHAFHAHDIFTAHRILHEVLCYHIDLETINSSNETRTLPSVVFQWMNASRQDWAIRAPLHWLKDVTRCAELLVMFWKTLIRKRCREEVVSNSGG